MWAGTSQLVEQPVRVRRGHVALTIGFHLLLCLLGLGAAFRPVWTSGFQKVVGAQCDGLLNNYFLEHSFQLVSNPNYRGGLWQPMFFYPAKNVLSYSDNLFGTAPIYWLYRLGFGPFGAYELWMATVLTLSYAAFAYLLRRHGVGQVLCGVGGYLFAFGMPRITQLDHSQLLPQFMTPLALLYLFGITRRPTLWRMNLAALLIFWQLLAGIYLGWFLALGSATYMVVALACDGQARRRFSDWMSRCFLPICGCCCGWAMLVMVVFNPYAQTARSLNGGRDFVEVDPMLPRLGSWLLPPPGAFWEPYLGGFAAHLFAPHEHVMFNGFVTWLATLLAVAACLSGRISSRRRRLIRLALLTFAAIFILSYRFPVGVTLWTRVFEDFPGAKAIRAVSRIWTIAYAFLLFGSLLGVDTLIRRWWRNSIPRAVAALMLAALAISEQLYVPPAVAHYAQFVSNTAEDASLIRGADAAYVMIDEPVADVQTDNDQYWLRQTMAMMWAGIETNVPVVNGYSAWWPPGFGPADKAMAPDKLVGFLGSSWHGTLRLLADKQDTASRRAIESRWPGASFTQSEHLVAFTVVLPEPIPAAANTQAMYNRQSQ